MLLVFRNFVLGFFLMSSLVAQAEKGFYNPQDFFPSEVNESVYRFASGLFFSQPINDREHFEKLKFDFKDHKLLPRQLEQCWQKKQSVCLMNLGVAVFGSVVAVDEAEDSVIWTNLHLVRPFLESKIEMHKGVPFSQIHKELKGWNIPLILKNRSGEVVFDSLNGSDEAHVVAIDSSTLNPEGSFRANSSDAVKMRLSRKIGPALKKGKILKPGDQAFVIGYPKKTDDRQTSHSAPDSRGDGHQHVTHGSILNPMALVEKYALDPLVATLMLDEHYIYAIDSDCEVGQSGGAIVNKQGEFVGLFQSILAPRSIGKHLACLGLNLNSLRFIEIMAE